MWLMWVAMATMAAIHVWLRLVGTARSVATYQVVVMLVDSSCDKLLQRWVLCTVMVLAGLCGFAYVSPPVSPTGSSHDFLINVLLLGIATTVSGDTEEWQWGCIEGHYLTVESLSKAIENCGALNDRLPAGMRAAGTLIEAVHGYNRDVRATRNGRGKQVCK
jgi:hypothetical protein